MKLTSLLAAALLPMGLMGAPIAEEAADVVARESVDVSANEPAGGLFKRTSVWCRVVGASEVNCRAGPGTNYGVETTISNGRMGVYTCVKTGECVNIGGKVNWLVLVDYTYPCAILFTAADRAYFSQWLALPPRCRHQRLLH